MPSIKALIDMVNEEYEEGMMDEGSYVIHMSDLSIGVISRDLWDLWMSVYHG